eukprot:TRINITY_DN7587_c0_g1_i1.p1 TRINITY_DN7587_c0_g1~~TRINITY_DN7587_c0_g1_i1.p1  ORF type:complete len:405 (+),score=58.77 TRINITY_DN7587_c0_g1_i1:213-1427(+)
MRKATLRRILFSSYITPRFLEIPFPSLNSHGGSLPSPLTASRPSSVFVNPLSRNVTTFLPPPEWIEPFIDISDLTVQNPRNLQPSPWINRTTNLLQDSPTMESDLNSFCHRFLIRLSPNFISHVLGSTHLSKTPKVAFRFFRWAEKQKGYTHKLESYVFLIDLLSSSAQDSEVVRTLVAEIRDRGFVMTSSTSNSLIRSLGVMGMVEELLWVWRWMKENGIEPSLYTYNFLMDGLVNSMFVDSAEQVFEAMEAGKIQPDIVTHNILIKGYCRLGKTRKAMDRFREMESKNVHPDKITYLTLIQSFYSDGDFDACLGLYNEMEEKGVEIPSHAYSLVIGALCRDGKVIEGYAVYESMGRRGCKANVAIYTALIDSFAKGGDVEEAMKLFKKMTDWSQMRSPLVLL